MKLIIKNTKSIKEEAKFGLLSFIKPLEKRIHKSKAALYQCDCGEQVALRISCVLNGYAKSCGCVSNRHIGRLKHNYSKSEKLYNIWEGIKKRCLNKNDPSYTRYGAKGIELYEPWRKDYVAFRDYVIGLPNFPDELLKVAKTRPTKTMDRINSKGNYEPNNVKWSSDKEQARNRSNNKIVVFEGKEYVLAELCEMKGLKYGTIHSRMYRDGLNIEQAINKPSKGR